MITRIIEKKPLMETLEELLTIEGLDMMQFSPSDYRLSLQTRRKPYIQADYREKVTAGRYKVYQMVLDARVCPRAEVSSAEQCQYFIDRGVHDFYIG